MTPEEIIDLVETLDLGLELDIVEDSVQYSCDVDIHGEEPHDEVWSALCAVHEELRNHELVVYDTWSDNNSFGGNIEPDSDIDLQFGGCGRG